MGEVISAFTMSLDGFVAGQNDDVSKIFKWYFSGDTDFPVAGTDMVFKIPRESADLLREEWGKIGAMVTGRRDFDVSQAWGGTPPLSVPMFIVTHNPPQEWVGKHPLFNFVTDGVESAIEQAKAAAGDKNVGVGGTTIVRQSLEAGLIDSIHIDLAHMLLGDGIRLFERLDIEAIELERTRTIATPDVTHLTFRVKK